jgi:hypothetical protein
VTNALAYYAAGISYGRKKTCSVGPWGKKFLKLAVALIIFVGPELVELLSSSNFCVCQIFESNKFLSSTNFSVQQILVFIKFLSLTNF